MAASLFHSDVRLRGVFLNIATEPLPPPAFDLGQSCWGDARSEGDTHFVPDWELEEAREGIEGN